MSKIITWLNNREYDENDYRITKILENIRNNPILVNLEESASGFSDLLNKPSESTGCNITGEFFLTKDQYYTEDGKEITYLNNYFIENTTLEAGDLVGSIINYRNQEMYVYENFKICPLFSSISKIIDSYIFLDPSDRKTAYYVGEEFLDDEERIVGTLFKYNENDEERFNQYGPGTLNADISSKWQIDYDGQVYTFINHNDETNLSIISDTPYFAPESYADKLNNGNDDERRNTANILSNVITYINNDDMKGWCMVSTDGDVDSSLEEIFDYINFKCLDSYTVGSTSFELDTEYQMFNVEAGNTAGITEGAHILLKTTIGNVDNLYLSDGETVVGIIKNSLNTEGMTDEEIENIKEEYTLLDKSESKIIDGSALETYFTYLDVKYTYRDSELFLYHFLEDIPVLKTELESDQRYLYNKSKKKYYLDDIGKIITNMTNMISEMDNINGDSNKKSYGNLNDYLYSSSEDFICYTPEANEEITTFALSDFMIQPKTGYAFAKDIYTRKNSEFFTSMKEIDNAYLDLQDKFNYGTKKTYLTPIFQIIAGTLFNKIPYGFSSDRPVLGTSMWLTLNKENPTIFGDERDPLLLSALNGASFSKLGRGRINHYLKILAANILDYIQTEYETYKNTILDNILTNSSDMHSSFNDFVSMFDDVFEDPTTSSQISKLGNIEEAMQAIVGNTLQCALPDYENLPHGYKVYETYNELLKIVMSKTFEITSVEDVEICQFLYIMSEFFNEDKLLNIVSFPVPQEGVGELRPESMRCFIESNRIQKAEICILNGGSRLSYIEKLENNSNENIEITRNSTNQEMTVLFKNIIDWKELGWDPYENIEYEEKNIGGTIKNILTSFYNDCKAFRTQYFYFINHLNTSVTTTNKNKFTIPKF